MKPYFYSILLMLGIASGAAAQSRLPSIDFDKQIGADAEREILKDPKEYPILPKKSNEAVYNYLEKIKTNILNSGKVTHAKDFDWTLHVINDPNTINAFATPGGYIYIYTGLIHFVDNEAELAGIIAHEMAHADRRHSVQQMGKNARSRLLQRRRGGDDGRVLGQLRSLRYDRTHESDADEYAVIYICATNYHTPSITGFFEKTAAEGGRQRPQFLSTHPNPDNRVEAMNAKIKEIGYSGTVKNPSGHEKIQASLPSVAVSASSSKEPPRKRLPLRERRGPLR